MSAGQLNVLKLEGPARQVTRVAGSAGGAARHFSERASGAVR
jgi:hypothetical protein